MSAFGPKRTSLVAPHISAFGGKADIMPCRGEDQKFKFGAPRPPAQSRVKRRRLPFNPNCGIQLQLVFLGVTLGTQTGRFAWAQPDTACLRSGYARFSGAEAT